MYHEPTFEPSRDEMMEILERNIPFLNRIEVLPLAEADGRVAAENMSAPYSLPMRPASSRDGIAVRFEDFASGMPDTSSWVEGREYVYSNTGVALPDGYDTVITIEKVQREGSSITLLDIPGKKNEEVQPAGSMMTEGELLVAQGERLTPVSLSILLAAGFLSVPVYAGPNVIFLPTGDELVTSGGSIPDGKNVETNSLLVCTLLRRFGCTPAATGIIPDDPGKLKQALLKAVKQADMVIICAGSSKGSKDFTMDVLEEIGTVIVQELGVAPGKHCSLTMVDNTPVLGIPGPPGGAQLIAQYYVRACAELLATGKRSQVCSVPAVLTEDIAPKQIGFMQSVILSQKDNMLLATPVMPFGKTRAQSRQNFTHVVYCPKGAGYQAGETVVVEFPCLEEL